MRKQVIIVGAGPCGLAALKETLEAGHEAICFERAARLGGTFASTQSDFYLTVSNWFMAFSDFPDPQKLCYSKAGEYLRYLQAYADHFVLERHIQYNSEIISATLSREVDNQAKWDLQVRRMGSKESVHAVKIFHADALIVATGANQVAKEVPSCLHGYTGRVLHSSEIDADFKARVASEKLNVLVVGGGESGSDIAPDLAALSPNVIVWLRRPPYIAPRYYRSDREMHSIEMNRENSKAYPPTAFQEAGSSSRIQAGLSIYANGIYTRALLYIPGLMDDVARNWGQEHARSSFFKCGYATYVTKNSRLTEAVKYSEIEALTGGNISVLSDGKGRTIQFAGPDGTKSDRNVDAVVLCTGYTAQFPWLHLPPGQEAVVQKPNPRQWFLHCFPPNLGHCLFFVGYARPHQGGIPATAEMLSRYIALILRENISLPNNYSLQGVIDGQVEKDRYLLSPNLDSLVDYNAFLESVARRIGCEPRLPAILILMFNLHMFSVLSMALRCLCVLMPGSGGLVSQVPSFKASLGLALATATGFLLYDDSLILKWWFYPHWSAWYRQRGPSANPMLLHTMLSRVPMKSCLNTRRSVLKQLFFYTILLGFHVPPFYVQRVLSVIVFVSSSLFTLVGTSLPGVPGRLQLLRPGLFAVHSTPWRFSDLFLP